MSEAEKEELQKQRRMVEEIRRKATSESVADQAPKAPRDRAAADGSAPAEAGSKRRGEGNAGQRRPSRRPPKNSRPLPGAAFPFEREHKDTKALNFPVPSDFKAHLKDVWNDLVRRGYKVGWQEFLAHVMRLGAHAGGFPHADKEAPRLATNSEPSHVEIVSNQ